MKRYILAAVLFAAVAAPAAAYTTYLQPDAYWPEDNDVQIQAAYANQFFTPQVAFDSEFSLIAPDLTAREFVRKEVGSNETTLEATLPSAGTYRISSGERLGRVATLVGVNGSWQELPEGQTAPEGSQITTLQTVTQSDVYVTRGQASREVIEQPTGHLALRPVTHPNQVLAADGFQVDVMFDGAPMPNTAVVLYSEGDADTDLDTYAVTDANGRATFTLPAAGYYVVAARHRANAPAGAEAAVRSYTTTLTFEALETLPEGYDVAARDSEQSERQRPRRRPNLMSRQRTGGN